MVGLWRGHHPAGQRRARREQLGMLDDYISAGFGFDAVEVFLPERPVRREVPAPPPRRGLPGKCRHRPARAAQGAGPAREGAGAEVRLGVTAETLEDDGNGVDVHFSDGSSGRYDLVIGADGYNSQTRR